LTEKDEGMHDSDGAAFRIRAKERASALHEQGDHETATLVAELADDFERIRRQLARLGFDLHDGPLQALAETAADLRHFQSQLTSVVGQMIDGDKLVNRIDDLVARTLDLSEQLRQLIIGTASDPATAAQLSTVFAGLTNSYGGFALHIDVEPAVDDLPLSDSQRITLARVVRSALDNVTQHSGARNVWVTVRSLEGTVEAKVVDDGAGFDPRRKRRGAIGLTAMEERVHMLDGELTIDTQPGGPTTVRVALPPWQGRKSLQ
jgi:signal transduction histidine kinase